MSNVDLIKLFNDNAKKEGDNCVYDTYNGWLARGYQVQKGEKSVARIDGRGCKTDKASKKGRKYFYDKILYLFDNTQVRNESGDCYKVVKTDDTTATDAEGFMILPDAM